jgi:hypothetical protein
MGVFSHGHWQIENGEGGLSPLCLKPDQIEWRGLVFDDRDRSSPASHADVVTEFVFDYRGPAKC